MNSGLLPFGGSLNRFFRERTNGVQQVIAVERIKFFCTPACPFEPPLGGWIGAEQIAFDQMRLATVDK
jgi:hypothetical protein